MKRFGTIRLLPLFSLVLLSLHGCNDLGNTPVSPPIVVNPESVTLTPGSQAVVQVSGGTPPYRLLAGYDTTVVTALFDEPAVSPGNLRVTGSLTSGNGSATILTIADAGGDVGQGSDHVAEVHITISAVSFANDLQPIFSASCALSGCHAGPNPVLGLSLSVGEAYRSLVNVPASSSSCNDQPRVLPGNSLSSVLYKRVSGTSCNFQMPLGGNPLPPSDQSAIRDWIDQGALDN